MFLGLYRTVERLPLVIAGRWFAPMLLDEPGQGCRIKGELLEVDADRLRQPDALDSVGSPGNLRKLLEIQPITTGPIRTAFAFQKDRSLATPQHADCMISYTDGRFIAPEDRPADA